jgi:hypothetical protein
MIAWIDGVMVNGSPEEIQRFREINAKKVTSTEYFNIPKDDVPEHVKQYGKHNFKYESTGQTHRVWF